MATNPKPRKTKSKSKPKKPVKRRATRVTNQNTVRVHVINSVGGDSAPPPPYSGPDRGYFAFNPVFDMGLPKQAIEPPMNTGLSVGSGPVRGQGTEIETQTLLSDNRDTDFIDTLTRDELRQYAKEIGIPIGSGNKKQLLRSVKRAVSENFTI